MHLQCILRLLPSSFKVLGERVSELEGERRQLSEQVSSLQAQLEAKTSELEETHHLTEQLQRTSKEVSYWHTHSGSATVNLWWVFLCRFTHAVHWQ